MHTLRPYQQDAINALWNFWRTTPQGAPLLSLPTGSGKSLVLASVINQVLLKHPKFKFLVVTHVKELIEQNAQEFQKLSGIMPAIFSAGLGSKRIAQVTFAGVQSLYKRPEHLDFDMMIVDEAHLISKKDGSMYQKLIKGLQNKNYKLKIFGLTATPMRMDQGSLIGEGSTFTDICYDISVRTLIDLGYLAPIISMPRGKESPSLKEVKTSGADFNQIDLEKAFNRESLIELHVDKMLEAGATRKAWLIFCSGIKHAEEVTKALLARGIPADYVTGDDVAFERDLKIKDFKSGKLKALCNVGVLTTGFNHPAVDMLVLLRATKSASLYIQMVGRGTRTAPQKENCLVLDFGGNITRHGPIDCISIKKGKKGAEKVSLDIVPAKACTKCGCLVSIRTLICPSCEWPFPDNTQELDIKPSHAPIISQIEEFEVIDFRVKRHTKFGSPDSVKIEYQIGDNGWQVVRDFLCFDHGGFATGKAQQKWIKISDWQRGDALPISTVGALLMAGQLKEPKSIKVIKKDKYYQIVDITYKTKEEVENTQDFTDF